jgi:predicted RNA-binding protein
VWQATVYLGGREIAQEISVLEPAEGGVRLESLFGESRFVPGRIRSIDFLKHRVNTPRSFEVGRGVFNSQRNT